MLMVPPAHKPAASQRGWGAAQLLGVRAVPEGNAHQPLVRKAQELPGRPQGEFLAQQLQV